MRRRRAPEIIAGRVNADGTIAAGDGFTVQKTGGANTGTYTITLAPGMRLVCAMVTGAAAANLSTNVGSTGSTSFNVSIWTANTVAAIDAAFGFVAVGVQQ